MLKRILDETGDLHTRAALDILRQLSFCRFHNYTAVAITEGLDGGGSGRGRGSGAGGGVWNSLISKNLAHYSLSLNFLLIL